MVRVLDGTEDFNFEQIDSFTVSDFCVSTGRFGMTQLWNAYVLPCVFPELTPFGQDVRTFSNSDMVNFQSNKPMAFAISRKTAGSEDVLYYGRTSSGSHQIFMLPRF